MTREEAIEVLESGRWWDMISGVHCAVAVSKELHAALDMAISALSTQQTHTQQTPAKLDRSRWEGCETCKGGRYRRGEYCPGYSRPLTEEAWAELERRINDGTADTH